jgi:23S rRNA pseudouridine2605 synthase
VSENEKPVGERIAKLLARAGVASRREIERMIADGRVALDGVVLDTPATILSHLRGVTVDGNPVAAAERTRLFRFHKPAGLITAERDPAGRPTIYTALRNALPPGTPRVMPVGRLDLSTEGLLLLTNDGAFKRELELPATGVPRTYRARTFGDITQGRLEDLMDGIEIEGIRYGQIDANMERRTGRNQWIELTLTEGKNREVRRVLEYLGLQVSRLIRTAYGPFVLSDLGRGQALEVRREELERFRSGLKLPPEERRAMTPSQTGARTEAPRPPRVTSAPVESGPKRQEVRNPGPVPGKRPRPTTSRADGADSRRDSRTDSRSGARTGARGKRDDTATKRSGPFEGRRDSLSDNRNGPTTKRHGGSGKRTVSSDGRPQRPAGPSGPAGKRPGPSGGKPGGRGGPAPSRPRGRPSR